MKCPFGCDWRTSWYDNIEEAVVLEIHLSGHEAERRIISRKISLYAIRPRCSGQLVSTQDKIQHRIELANEILEGLGR